MKESRLGIPLFFAYDVVHGHRTIFPIGLGLASSWDMDVVRRSARVAAEEASADALDMTFAPMVDISRDPRWGRVMEGAGEDTYLGSKIAYARVKGFQGDGIGELWFDSIEAAEKAFATEPHASRLKADRAHFLGEGQAAFVEEHTAVKPPL